ncbi:glycosyltransferase [Vibrio vulnificus]|nr:glycosyltransferase [Vibrio vulnificus]
MNSKTKRICFVYAPSTNWVGGKNYYISLFNQIENSKVDKYEYYIFTPKDISVDELNRFTRFKIVKTSLLNKKYNKIRAAVDVFFSEQSYLIPLLKKHRINILSHSYVSPFSKVKSLPWIPDFQHKYLPEFFKKRELKIRDRRMTKYFRFCDVIVSSQSARDDAYKYFHINNNVFVYRFNPVMDVERTVQNEKEEVCIDGKYLFLPNQFWRHKNHILFFEAIRKCVKEGMNIKVICTGKTSDYRNPEYYSTVEGFVKENNLSENIVILGLVDRERYIELLNNCHFFINPSLFEGWSTTVEEAKFLNKRLLLSDITVHKEQVENYKNSYFFKKDCVSSCSNMLRELWNTDGNITSSVKNGNDEYLKVVLGEISWKG